MNGEHPNSPAPLSTDQRCRPVLFSAPMVRAILEGRKTQTRRLVKLPHQNPLGEWEPSTVGGTGVFAKGRNAPEQACLWHTRTGDVVTCPYGVDNDLLWVRETHYAWSAGYLDGSGRRIAYRATEPDAPCTWTPSIHMPRWASRLTLRVTSVRVERLNDISPEDAAAEGWPGPDENNSIASAYPIAWYARLWDQINGPRSYDTNPWVWAVSFERSADSMRAAA